jgi:formate dehydrogenase gamma subunit
MKKVYLYKGYERFWHWAQAVLVFTLILTGFEIHSSYSLFGFETSVRVHNISAWAFLVLTVFTIFWDFTTGEWKQYLPTSKNLKAQIQFYLSGIFKNAPHPAGKSLLSKLNPLQRIVYGGLKIMVFPVMFITGFLYYFFHYPVQGVELSSLETVAILHTLGAFAVVSFTIVHLYLITTGHTVTSNLKAMITGWEEVDEAESRHIEEEILAGSRTVIKPARDKKKNNVEKEKVEVK